MHVKTFYCSSDILENQGPYFEEVFIWIAYVGVFLDVSIFFLSFSASLFLFGLMYRCCDAGMYRLLTKTLFI